MVNHTARTMCGTPEYVAPGEYLIIIEVMKTNSSSSLSLFFVFAEILKGEDYGISSDFWAVGVLLYEMVIGYSPFCDASEDYNIIYTKIVNGEYNFPCKIGKHCKSLIKKLLTVNASKRLGTRDVKEIKEHPFFKDIVWNPSSNYPPLGLFQRKFPQHDSMEDLRDKVDPNEPAQDLWMEGF